MSCCQLPTRALFLEDFSVKKKCLGPFLKVHMEIKVTSVNYNRNIKKKTIWQKSENIECLGWVCGCVCWGELGEVVVALSGGGGGGRGCELPIACFHCFLHKPQFPSSLGRLLPIEISIQSFME